MKASYFLGKHHIEFHETKVQEPKEHEVLIQVKACGICGTDVHIYNGEEGSAEVKPPVILGHEFAGEVVRTGEEVHSLRVGDHVTVDPNIYCGVCKYCKMGKKQMCENLFAIGVNRDGGFAEFCTVPEGQCIKVKSSIPYEYIAMAEPIACCIHGLNNISVNYGDTVCIIGGGAIGLIMTQLVKRSGASKVIVSEPIKNRREVALELGADYTINPLEENMMEQFQKYLGKQLPDLVVECVGSAVTSKQAIEIAGKGGRVLLFGVPSPKTAIDLLLSDVFKKELTIKGSFINPDTQQAAVDLIENNCIDLQKIITHCFPLNKLDEAINKQTQNDSLKVMVINCY